MRVIKCIITRPEYFIDVAIILYWTSFMHDDRLE
jgi:hypothetical protein